MDKGMNNDTIRDDKALDVIELDDEMLDLVVGGTDEPNPGSKNHFHPIFVGTGTNGGEPNE